ncbi:MAG: hypothetical protein EHM87_15770 [Burkholderiales bacterium]|nr:MAG: hypothetical protein EHM87_15770 [Burkholderiales bacterium]
MSGALPIAPAVRHVAFDTETTGFSGARVVELAAVEFDPASGDALARFHTYLDPQGTPVEAGALSVHGLSDAFLRGQPRFADVADAFVGFVAGARLYAHNAPFDRRMLDAELARIERPGLGEHVAGIVCTLALANRGLAHLPKKKLDDLCDHFAVDRSARTLHGALIDCELLARVAVRMGATTAGVAKTARRTPSAPREQVDPDGRVGWRAGGPWLGDEREALVAAWRRGETVPGLVARHGRTARAIVMQLQRLGEIDDSAAESLLAAAGGGGLPRW